MQLLRNGWDMVRVSWRARLWSGVRPRGSLRLLRALATGRRDLFLSLAKYAVERPEHLAVSDDAGAMTFAELYDQAIRLAGHLQARGLRRRQRVGIVLRNRSEFFVAMAAALHLGCIAAPMSPHSPLAATRKKLAAAQLSAVVIEEDLAPASPIEPLVPGSDRWHEALRHAPAKPDRGLMWFDDEPDMMLYTSGTTGSSKGARINMRAAAVTTPFRYLAGFDLRRGDHLFTSCPLYHAAPMLLTGLSLAIGARVSVSARFEAAEVIDRMVRDEVTHAFLVPTLIDRLLRHPDVARLSDAPLRALISGGAALRADLKKKALESIGPKIFDFYGATELGIVSIAGPQDLDAHPESVGRPLPDLELRFLGEDGRATPNGPGELWVRSDMISAYEGVEATHPLEAEGFATAGDIAELRQGYLHIVGRKKDVIVSGGANVFPAEVEEVVRTHPSVRDAAVVGRPDPKWGEAVTAFVVLAPDAQLDPSALKAHCKERLNRVEVPKSFHAIDELPRNPTGKLLRRRLSC